MGTILFAANEPSGVVIPDLDPINYEFGTARNRIYEAAYSPRGEFVVRNRAQVMCPFTEAMTPGDEFWIHFKSFTGISVGGLNAQEGTIFCAYTDLNPAARPISIYTTNSLNQVTMTVRIGTDLIGGAATAGVSQNVVTGGSSATWDIKIKLDSVIGYVLVYRNGALFMSYFGDTTGGGLFTTISGFWVAAPRDVYTNTNPGISISCAYTELLASRNRTLGQRVISFYPTADGSPMDWDGDYTNISATEPDDGVAIASNTADQDALFQINAASGSLDPTLRLAGLFTSGRIYNDGIGAVQRVAHLLKSPSTGETIYASSTLTLPEAHPISGQEWLTNPDNSEQWLLEDLAGLQIGLRAKV